MPIPGIMPVAGAMQPSAIWRTAASFTLNTNETGWNNITQRMFIDQTSLLLTGGSQCRLTFQCPATGGVIFDSVYFGQAISGWTDTAPSFNAAPTQVKVAGSGTITLVPAGADVVTDPFLFSLPASLGVCLSMHITTDSAGAANSTVAKHVTLPAASGFGYKSAANASDIVAAGYTSYSATIHLATLKKIEIFA